MVFRTSTCSFTTIGRTCILDPEATNAERSWSGGEAARRTPTPGPRRVIEALTTTARVEHADPVPGRADFVCRWGASGVATIALSGPSSRTLALAPINPCCSTGLRESSPRPVWPGRGEERAGPPIPRWCASSHPRRPPKSSWWPTVCPHLRSPGRQARSSSSLNRQAEAGATYWQCGTCPKLALRSRPLPPSLEFIRGVHGLLCPLAFYPNPGVTPCPGPLQARRTRVTWWRQTLPCCVFSNLRYGTAVSVTMKALLAPESMKPLLRSNTGWGRYGLYTCQPVIFDGSISEAVDQICPRSQRKWVGTG